jgi:hypothetical protein
MGYSVWDLYKLKHGPDAGPCPQPHRLRYFAYAMGLIAGEVEARKFGLDRDPGRSEARVRKGVDLRLPGGGHGFKPTER